MSSVLWHTRDDETQLHGAERGWCRHLAAGPVAAAWDLHSTSILERLAPIMRLIPEVPDGEYGANYLHNYYRSAVEADRTAMARSRSGDHGHFGKSSRVAREFVTAFDTAMKVNPPQIVIAGHTLYLGNVNMNTALVAGSDPIRLAAKINGWCEAHCWVAEPDRAWMAGVIDAGRKAGLYRSAMGWENVQAMLRTADDGPVVLSYTVTESFPNPFYHPDAPTWPAGVPRDWNALTPKQQQTRRAWESHWYEIDAGEAFDAAMLWLQADRPWAQITPGNLATEAFGPMVTVYDLFADDRDERVARAVALDKDSIATGRTG
ncbi:hypothetical protein [Frankia sp. Cj3]|uniref:hypothetical protein n=1 Tax=Frankia sp. Cj3 TaxID=2880976 RepID=UPI001EF3F6DE|nr:hypothetical protein [Frankia sp. Cj3]